MIDIDDQNMLNIVLDMEVISVVIVFLCGVFITQCVLITN